LNGWLSGSVDRGVIDSVIGIIMSAVIGGVDGEMMGIMPTRYDRGSLIG
jgi:hypothetical protein